MDQMSPLASHDFRRRMRRTKSERLRREDDGDWKLFVMSFAAFFVCFYTFIA